MRNFTRNFRTLRRCLKLTWYSINGKGVLSKLNINLIQNLHKESVVRKYLCLCTFYNFQSSYKIPLLIAHFTKYKNELRNYLLQVSKQTRPNRN
jgi:hypothetical protein